MQTQHHSAEHLGPLRRIGLIGDVHAEHELLAQALAFLTAPDIEPLDALLCTGDIADGGGCVDQCCELLASYNVHTVRGNHDRWLLTDKVRHVDQAHQRSALAAQTQAYLAALPQTLSFDTPMGRGLLCHGIGDKDLAKVWPGSERLAPEANTLLDGLIEAADYRLLLNGHMHFRTVIHFEAFALLNAGTLKPRHRPGFSVVDFSSGDILAYEFAGPRCEHVITRSLHPAPDNRVWRNTQQFDGDWQPTTLYAS